MAEALEGAENCKQEAGWQEAEAGPAGRKSQ